MIYYTFLSFSEFDFLTQVTTTTRKFNVRKIQSNRPLRLEIHSIDIPLAY